MSTSDYLKTLREYQSWRRGGEGEMLDPKAIGLSIDATIAEVEALRGEVARLSSICVTAHDRLLRGDDDAELLEILGQAWADRK